MNIERRFTTAGQDVFSTVEWTTRSSRITNQDGSLVFEMNDAIVPKTWSQLAVDIMVSKYFRKAGVPQFDETGKPMVDKKGEPITGPERSAKQVIHRLAGCWRAWGEQHNYFKTADDAQAFYDELAYMMLHQMSAPNSPQWFNTGLHWAYGITGPAQGHWVCDPATGDTHRAPDAYSHPQPHACFIQAVDDDLVNDGGIMDLWTREARLFKYGSGTGTNFSRIRGENEALSGGGKSSGLMSFLKIGDRAAGAIKSGGTTRRAAKMVCLDADHPDIENFVNWKVREELKVAALVEGLKHLDTDKRDLAERLGLELNYDFNGEAYYTVSGQNSNNSVRLNDEFFKAVKDDADWNLNARTSDNVAKTIKARDLWSQICEAAWRCADPGLQFDTTINAWHTCPQSGRINASNPCSEYMFLDNTACNLASINLITFYDSESRSFDLERFEHAIELWTMVLEISVLMAAFPSEEIASQSYRYRTLGLGFANLGAMLMQAGIPYDSEAGRAICAAISAILTGRSYATSAKMAEAHGSFPGYADNKDDMLRVIRNHRLAAKGEARDSEKYEDLSIRPVPIKHSVFKRKSMPLANATALLKSATRAWDDALKLGEKHGYRNAQVTVIAPTGTIGLLMDCDTTGVEPDFALVKFKKLAGGGYFKIANASLRPALTALGYSDTQVDEMVTYVMGTLSLDTPMPDDSDDAGSTFRDVLENLGYTPDDLIAVENALPTVFELGFAFTAWSMPEHVLSRFGIDIEAARNDMSFNGLRTLGLTDRVVAELNRTICGTQTIEGSPHVKDADLAVFDCANKCGEIGERFIVPSGHIHMMAAAQPFISGAISKTINLPNDADVDDIADAYQLSWELGLKANALYRDGSKLSQPLNTKSDSDTVDEDVDAVEDALVEVAAEVAQTAGEIVAAPAEPQYIERIVERIVERPLRRRLPDTRRSLTHHFNVAGHEGYLTVGLYENGAPGELFITMSKEGSTIGGLMDSLGTAISVALQYGVPVESLVNKFAHQRFEPMGITTNRDIPFAKSLVDYIFRWMGMEFISGYREANAPQRAPERTSGDSNATTVKEDKTWSGSKEHEADTASDDRRIDRAEVSGASTRITTSDDGDIPAKTGGPTARFAVPAADAAMTISSIQTEETTVRVHDGEVETTTMSSTLSQATASMQTDAPACDVCGSITVRNGTCYKCLNCGNSMGCS
ncbi:MAG: adenosylcobalamin-dependent ribonucleoside-diphosphate reductase [Planctomycetota bacterium]